MNNFPNMHQKHPLQEEVFISARKPALEPNQQVQVRVIDESAEAENTAAAQFISKVEIH